MIFIHKTSTTTTNNKNYNRTIDIPDTSLIASKPQQTNRKNGTGTGKDPME